MQQATKLPASLHALVNKALHCHAVAGKWRDEVGATKTDITAYLLKKTGQRYQGLTLKTELGEVRQQTSTTYKIDVSKVMRLLEQDKIDLETLLKGANFSATALRESLGPFHFERATIATTARSLVVKPNEECKSEVRAA